MLTIVRAPNQVLSEKAKPVKKIDTEIVRLIADMKKTLVSQKDPEGVGLAAPQVAKSLQLFIIKPTLKVNEQVFINPHITISEQKKKRKRKSSSTKLEGCLSLPSIWGEVQRADTVTVSYQNEDGKEQTETFTGFSATIIQHEYDHLQGILFPKRVLEQKGTLYKSHKEKGQEVFDPIDI